MVGFWPTGEMFEGLAHSGTLGDSHESGRWEMKQHGES